MTRAGRKRPQRVEELRDAWLAAWPAALEAWSKFTRLRPPTLCLSAEQAKHEGLTQSFAMIRLVDQAVVVSLPDVMASGLEDYAVEVLAHEIGHHVLAPATLSDHARMIARMRWALPTIESQAPMVANLYTDLLINDRLHRSAELRMGAIYERLRGEAEPGLTWTVYMRIYEVLWNLPRGTLVKRDLDARVEGDAWLGARLLRSYARDWLDGSGRFAALLLPYLLDDAGAADAFAKLLDTRAAGAGGDPAGLSDEDADERAGAIHPAHDPDLYDVDVPEPIEAPPVEDASAPPLRGQARQPFEYGEILRASGVTLTDHDVAVRYYRERAIPYLVPFPARRVPHGTEPLPEGLEPWDIGHPIDAVDWLQTVLQSPRVIPGMTTVQRIYGTTEGREPERQPLDLDLYVDSSGSMANPQRQLSFPALAGAIICLSALRAGASVQATLWSGKQQLTSTDGFVRNEDALLRVLTGYYGGGTAFPIHKLRDTFSDRDASSKPAHILIVSDDGVSTMFDDDERGQSGWDVSKMALEKARGGGTMVLQLADGWETSRDQGYYGNAYAAIALARDQQGWNVHRVASWEDLVSFAREFSRLRYGGDEPE
jgi:hypothetical protein